MKFKDKIIFTLLIIIFSSFAVCAQVKEIKLQTGSTLLLDPSPDKEYVTLLVLLDRFSNNWDDNQTINAELYFNALKKEIKAEINSTYEPPLRLLPENFYNWTKFRYTVLHLTKSQFSQQKNELISIFNQNAEYKKSGIAGLLLEYSDICADSLLYTKDEYQQINSKILKLERFSENKTELIKNSDNFAESVYIYIYGGFNPLNLIQASDVSGVIAEKDCSPENSNVQPPAAGATLEQTDDQTVLRLSLDGKVKESDVILLFISEFLKNNLYRFSGAEEYRIYYPWNPERSELIFYLKNTNTFSVSDSIEAIFSDLQEVSKEEFSKWYFNKYADYIEQVKSSPEKHILLKLLSYLAGNRFEKYDQIYLDNTDFYRHFRQIISNLKIVKTH